VLLDPERLERGLDAFLEAEKEKAGGDPEKEARVFANRIAEVDRKRAAFQDLVADSLMEGEELRAKLDALSRQKAAEEGLRALEERRSRVRELELSRETILARYRRAAPEELEKADGEKRRAVYDTLGVTVWAAKAKEDPIRIEMSALGGEDFCREDATSRRSSSSANPPSSKGFGVELVLRQGAPKTSFRASQEHLNYERVRKRFRYHYDARLPSEWKVSSPKFGVSKTRLDPATTVATMCPWERNNAK
jgi:hypothetical protein